MQELCFIMMGIDSKNFSLKSRSCVIDVLEMQPIARHPREIGGLILRPSRFVKQTCFQHFLFPLLYYTKVGQKVKHG